MLAASRPRGSSWHLGSRGAAHGPPQCQHAGSTSSLDFPLKNPFEVLLPDSQQFSDYFIAKLNASGTDLVYSSYQHIGYTVGLDAAGAAYLAGIQSLPPTYNSQAVIAKVGVSGPGDTAGAFFIAPASQMVLPSAGSATVNVGRAGGLSGTVSVRYSAQDGTAFAGIDYSPTANTLTFQDGETTKGFSVPLIPSNAIKGDETFTVSLSNPGGGGVLTLDSQQVITVCNTLMPRPTFPFTFTVTGAPGGWVASTDAGWIVLLNVQGNADGTVTGYVDTSNLPNLPASYQGTITVQTPDGSKQKVILNLSMNQAP